MQFVVLHHMGYGDEHYDLMFELEPGGLLATWRSPVWPLRHETPLTPLKDHRRDYLTYEGEVSGGRGSVRRVAGGDYDLIFRGRTMLIVRLPDDPQEWLIADHPAGSVAVRAT